jgi:hypothetical protein
VQTRSSTASCWQVGVLKRLLDGGGAGYTRILAEDYEREALDMILASIDEVGASLDDVPLVDIVDSLPDFPAEVLLCCLKKYGTQKSMCATQ